jgi:hypothetical protein
MTAEDGPVPATPEQPAVALAPNPGEATLTLTLTLNEAGAIAASLQTCVHSGWVRQPSDLNTVNSVLRKLHDAKLELAERLP